MRRSPTRPRLPGRQRPKRSLLRFLTCGSVDDGKSTLIGRLLYEQKLIFDDQLSALEKDSKKHGTTGDDIDFALLVDGLEAEREQGITIDVAYRYFATEKRSFIVADTPGHEQYTRNMATGASNADLAILLVDARKGLLTQTRRHSLIVSLLGIRHVVLAVNKIDLVDFSQKVFDDIVAAYREFSEPTRLQDAARRSRCRRASATTCRQRSQRTPWYEGPTLLEHLESQDVDEDRAAAPFRLPVQWVNRPNLDFRGYAGTIASGARRASATRSSSPIPAASRKVASLYRRRRRRRETRGGRRRGDADARRRSRHRARRRAVPRRRRGRRSPTSSPRM